ncbi:type III pantothenate kinase [Rhodococcus chondri]|uniref:Type III pantothenate kinase n=1 Tax=Rhodococcus chondri TaxID=3065941 RepID=A0ABU7JNK3_9NOCA|nr:type III pantothenate kinase [Rhodococcus sp. CC-R104]MEE2031390.1 type III pantothenate kinase [Rhodococcus sp. CC-R104]
MLLTVDVRNTNIVLGLFTGSGSHAKLLQDWRVRTDPRMTADELALLFRGLLGRDAEQITGVAALSTVPSVLRELRVMLARYWDTVPHVVVEPGVRTGVPLLVDNPKEVGADRIVNSLAAHHFYGSPCIVVDFGTSTCVDVVSGKGEFLGGAIAPGVEISMDALASRSAALRKVELARPRGVLGKNTVECMQAGAVFGFAGMVDGLVRRVCAEVPGFAGSDVAVIGTGDSAPLIMHESRTLEHHEPDLTLEGLRLVYERNLARRAARGGAAGNFRGGSGDSVGSDSVS